MGRRMGSVELPAAFVPPKADDGEIAFMMNAAFSMYRMKENASPSFEWVMKESWTFSTEYDMKDAKSRTKMRESDERRAAMELMESIRAGLKELILPELDRIREDNRELKAMIQLTNKRLDDVNLHLADQSRRIDETNKRIDDVNKRIDDVNKRIDDVNKRIDETNKRVDETNNRVDGLRDELVAMIMENGKRLDDMSKRIDDSNKRIDETNRRIDSVHLDLISRFDDTNRQIGEARTEAVNMNIGIGARIDKLAETMVRREEAINLDRRVYALEQHVENLQRRLAA